VRGDRAPAEHGLLPAASQTIAHSALIFGAGSLKNSFFGGGGGSGGGGVKSGVRVMLGITLGGVSAAKTCQPCVAQLELALPSSPRTRNSCRPGASPEYHAGDAQAAGAAPSREHSNAGQPPRKANIASADAASAGGAS